MYAAIATLNLLETVMRSAIFIYLFLVTRKINEKAYIKNTHTNIVIGTKTVPTNVNLDYRHHTLYS